jgi:hypothetical protein
LVALLIAGLQQSIRDRVADPATRAALQRDLATLLGEYDAKARVGPPFLITLPDGSQTEYPPALGRRR